MKNLLFISTCLLLATVCSAKIITVDVDGSADYHRIQDAINNSTDGDIVRVFPGIYFESINFYGKAITVTGTNPQDPEIVANTIISRSQRFPSETVRFDCGEDENSILTGFTIQATDSAQHRGYGIYCHYSSPLLSNMVIKNHMIGVKAKLAMPTLQDLHIHNNSRSGIESIDGEIKNCRIENNGIYGLFNCNGRISNCVISKNGNVGLYDCDGSIINCLIIENGEGLYDCGGQIKNCTIAENTSRDGLRRCHGEIKNCIIVSNGMYGLNNCLGDVKYNNVWGNEWGNYNGGMAAGTRDIHVDPLFAGSDDYHLKSKTGRWDRDVNRWIKDNVTSPCIDVGGNRNIAYLEPQPNGDRINLGFYGGTTEASKSINEQQIYLSPVLADSTDGKIIFSDFATEFSSLVKSKIFTKDEKQKTEYAWEGNEIGNAYDIILDADGNVYVTGGSGGFESPCDYVTIKYNSNGNQLWVARYQSPNNGYDFAKAMAIDHFGNLYVTGLSKRPDGKCNYATIKYDSKGNELWAAQYDSMDNNNDGASSISIDSFGNVYVTGFVAGSGVWQNRCTVKYDSNGNQIWAIVHNGPSNDNNLAKTIVVDGFSNAYITGYIKVLGTDWDYTTSKYDANGNRLWEVKYNGTGNSDDYAKAIAMDSFGYVYVTGKSKGTDTNTDYATTKYDSNGNQHWVTRYNGPNNGDDCANAITTDNLGNVYVTGGSAGLDIYSDYVTIKYDSNGKQLWVARYSGTGNNYVKNIP